MKQDVKLSDKGVTCKFWLWNPFHFYHVKIWDHNFSPPFVPHESPVGAMCVWPLQASREKLQQKAHTLRANSSELWSAAGWSIVVLESQPWHPPSYSYSGLCLVTTFCFSISDFILFLSCWFYIPSNVVPGFPT